MNKLFILFTVTGIILVGCSQEKGHEGIETSIESNSEIVTNTNSISIELKEKEEIDIFKEAVGNSKKEPGIVNMTNPQYHFSTGEDTHFLWITEDSGTIMNTNDTHTIYTLSSSSAEEIYKFVNKS